MKDSCLSGREIAGGESRRLENWSPDSMGFLCADPYLTRREAGKAAIYVSSTRRSNQEVQTRGLRPASGWSPTYTSSLLDVIRRCFFCH
jgi:hypothetical protein